MRQRSRRPVYRPGDMPRTPDMNGGHLMRMRKYEASVLRSERMIIFAFALWAVYLWGVEPFLHYRHVGGF